MMTQSTTSSSLSKLNDEVLALTKTYQTSKSSEDLRSLISKTLELTVFIHRYEYNHNNRVLKDFDQDVSLEYLGMALSDRNIVDPHYKIKGIIAKRFSQHNKSTSYNTPGVDNRVDTSTLFAIDNKLLVNDIVSSELEQLPSRICALILFYTANIHLLKNFIAHYPSSLEKYAVVIKVYSIRKKIMNESDRDFDITFSKNKISNLLLLSGLFNENPQMFVLLTLLGDFKKFLTFISLFENSAIKVPKIADINTIFSKSSAVSNSFGEDDLSVRDKKTLLSLVTDVKLEDVTPDTKMNKFLDEYLAELIANSVNNWSKIEEKQFKHLDFSNPRKVKEAYTIANEELTNQLRLLKEVTTTLGTIKELNTTISSIKNQQ